MTPLPYALERAATTGADSQGKIMSARIGLAWFTQGESEEHACLGQAFEA